MVGKCDQLTTFDRNKTPRNAHITNDKLCQISIIILETIKQQSNCVYHVVHYIAVSEKWPSLKYLITTTLNHCLQSTRWTHYTKTNNITSPQFNTKLINTHILNIYHDLSETVPSNTTVLFQSSLLNSINSHCNPRSPSCTPLALSNSSHSISGSAIMHNKYPTWQKTTYNLISLSYTPLTLYTLITQYSQHYNNTQQLSHIIHNLT